MSGVITLLKTKRFSSLFMVQFFGAFSDNVFKSALLILITYKFSQQIGIEASILNMAAAGIFILPFFLFSAFGGLLADKFAKHKLIRAIKAFELIILAVASYAFIQDYIWLLFVCLSVIELVPGISRPRER